MTDPKKTEPFKLKDRRITRETDDWTCLVSALNSYARARKAESKPTSRIEEIVERVQNSPANGHIAWQPSKAITITGIHIHNKDGNIACVDLEIEGRWVPVLVERIEDESMVSHIVEPTGIERCCETLQPMSSTMSKSELFAPGPASKTNGKKA